MWNLIQPTFDYLPVDNTREHENRQKLCVDESRNALPLVSGALYVDRYLSEETRVKAVPLINYIKNEFVNSLNQTTWVDEETRTRLEEKVEAMTSIVGYQDWILDPCQLDAKYEDLVEPTTKTFKFKPDRVHAQYEYHLNMMVVYAGLLQEPIISKNYPTSYLYGMLGSVLAHEIIHAFDNTGRKHDKYGNLNETWTPRVVEEFARRSKCFIDQYSTFELYGQNISGVLTLPENIADNGGLNLAFKAYRSSVGSDEARLPGVNLTDDQLFFVGMSQFFCALETRESAIRNMRNSEHALNHFRVLGSNSNSREFSKAFNCPLNSPMNPENKCVIWRRLVSLLLNVDCLSHFGQLTATSLTLRSTLDGQYRCGQVLTACFSVVNCGRSVSPWSTVGYQSYCGQLWRACLNVVSCLSHPVDRLSQ
ncbi:Endothelin-converting enzyme 1 [Bulinus truncatus]|nr:Endothelin-converting enzyme 1 [Bulinus truncatus]